MRETNNERNVQANGQEDHFRKSITVHFLDYTLNKL